MRSSAVCSSHQTPRVDQEHTVRKPKHADESKTKIRIPNDLYERITRASSEDVRSINGEIIHLLEKGLAQRRREQGER
jgi:hypothetical protein